MSNMTFCRFEVTYNHLLECQEALQDAGSIRNIEEASGEYEKPYAKKLVKLCQEIVDEFGSEA